MKKNTAAAASTVTLFVPWTILYLRTFDWALETPAAQIIISCYAAFMILSGIYAIRSYSSGKARGRWMQVCTVINGIYAVCGAAAFVMMIPGIV